MKLKLIILLGPPGSGKGTWSKLLLTDPNFQLFSTGNLFRSLGKLTDPIAKLAQDKIAAGELVPDDITNKLVLNSIKSYNVNQGQFLLLDGYPRTLQQAEYLKKYATIDYVFYINCSLEEIMKRLTQRLICPKCQQSYNNDKFSPRTIGVCDNDGNKLVQRDDDKPSIIANRYKVYLAKTTPLISYFNHLGLLQELTFNSTSSNALNKIKKLLS